MYNHYLNIILEKKNISSELLLLKLKEKGIVKIVLDEYLYDDYNIDDLLKICL